MTTRSGIGIDFHPLVEGRRLVLGGVHIPFDKGLAGHSDGDVLVHAIIDGVLGASSLGDIGTHFPSSDERYRGIESTLLLADALRMVTESGWRVTYVDATILAENPTLKPFMTQAKESLAQHMGLDPGSVNLKATTADGLGFLGRGEGIGALAIATVERTT